MNATNAPEPDKGKPPPAPAPVDLADESIAGEEDPGAALDEMVGVPQQPPPPPRRKD